MKKLISLLLTLVMITGTAAVFAAVPQNHETLFLQDFDENYDSAKWKATWTDASSTVPEIVSENGNNVYKIYPKNNVTMLYAAPSVCTVTADIKLDYTTGAWTQILDIGYEAAGSDNHYALNAVKQDADTYRNGKLILNNIGSPGKKPWVTKELSEGNKLFSGKWVTLSAELADTFVKIYIDGELMIEWNEFNKPNKYIGFRSSGSTLYLDNVSVSKEKIVASEVSKDSSRYTILYQDFENLSDGGKDEINSMGYEVFSNFAGAADEGFEGNGKGYNFIGTYNTADLKLPSEYTIEMNIKLERPEGKSSYPAIKFNRTYPDSEQTNKFYFNADGSTAVPSYVRIDGAQTKYSVRTPGDAPFDLYAWEGKWAYMKIEKTPGEMKFYWNNTEKPSFTFTMADDVASGGGIAIESSQNSKMIIDNLYISAPSFPKYSVTAQASAKSVYDINSGTSEVTVDAYITNVTETDIDYATVIAAAYDGDRLAGTGVVSAGNIPANAKNGTAYTPVEKQISFTVNGDGSKYSYKVFVWNMDGFAPIIKNLDIAAQ